MRTYITKSGDMWDGVAREQMGSERDTDLLMRENPEHLEVYIFPAGKRLLVPEGRTQANRLLPPWKRGEA